MRILYWNVPLFGAKTEKLQLVNSEIGLRKNVSSQLFNRLVGGRRWYQVEMYLSRQGRCKNSRYCLSWKMTLLWEPLTLLQVVQGDWNFAWLTFNSNYITFFRISSKSCNFIQPPPPSLFKGTAMKKWNNISSGFQFLTFLFQLLILISVSVFYHFFFQSSCSVWFSVPIQFSDQKFLLEKILFAVSEWLKNQLEDTLCTSHPPGRAIVWNIKL